MPTTEFGMITAETACWEIERKWPNFLWGLLLAALSSSILYSIWSLPERYIINCLMYELSTVCRWTDFIHSYLQHAIAIFCLMPKSREKALVIIFQYFFLSSTLGFLALYIPCLLFNFKIKKLWLFLAVCIKMY